MTLRYDSGAQALDDVSLTIAHGERVCVLGANGSGKSTLASVVCGLLAPDAGAVTLVGEQVFDATRENPIDFDAYRRARRALGLVFQNPDDQIVTTVVEEDVAFGPENLGVPPTEIGTRVARELRRVALTDFAKADPTHLSGGQKQRVAIAGALAMEPQVLVLDEPGSLLDVRGRAAIMRVMGRLHGTGTTVVHITHFMEEALAADRVIVMEGGRIALQGTPQEVFAHGEQLAALGLEEPFSAQLATRLRAQGVDVPWTCDERELVEALVQLWEGQPAATRAARQRGQSLLARPARQNGTVPVWLPQPLGTVPVSQPLGTVPDGERSEPAGNCPQWRTETAARSRGGLSPMAKRSEPAGDCPPWRAEPAAQGMSQRDKQGTTPAPAVPEVLSVHHVSYAYQHARKALDDVTFGVRAGSSVALVGQTGSGKSTLLRLLCALEVPDEGRVVVRGTSTARKRDRRRLHGTIGYVMQHPERQLFAETVVQDVSFGPANLGFSPQEVERRAHEALARVGLVGLDDASPFELSGGQQRLCAIAGILAMDPSIIVLDEPMAGLDPRGRRELRRILRAIQHDGVTVVQVTHSMDDAARAEQVVVLNQGQVMLQGRPHDVFCARTQEVLEQAGLGLPQALAWAYQLEGRGLPELGEPLTLAELAAALAQALRGEAS